MRGSSNSESPPRRAEDHQIVDEPCLEGVIRLVSAQTGLHIAGQHREALRTLLASRLQAHKWLSPEQYLQRLATETPEATLEWNELIMRLTTGESYFFRDAGQFALLRNAIVPELIERRRAQRSLRIWSAGCSTGEEAYSLAILVHELLPHREGWQLVILGSDLNRDAIEKARSGIYGAWSFRMVYPELQRRYFR